MAQPTYTARVIVLRKTKLGESDLIVTMVDDQGAQLRAVAKGARKPRSPFAARLELYSECDVLLACGKSLDIVKEARIVESNDRARRDMEHAACAAVMAELLDRTTQADLEIPKLFALSSKALRVLCDVSPDRAPAIAAAHCLKTYAFLGVRPQLCPCAVCGRPLADDAAFSRGEAWASAREGGAVCGRCRAAVPAVPVESSTLEWAEALLFAPLEEVAAFEGSTGPAFAVLSLCRDWAREHFGVSLKSMDFLFTCGLF